MTLFFIIPIKEKVRRGFCIPGGAEPHRKRWEIRPGFELALGVRVIIDDLVSAVSFGYS